MLFILNVAIRKWNNYFQDSSRAVHVIVRHMNGTKKKKRASKIWKIKYTRRDKKQKFCKMWQVWDHKVNMDYIIIHRRDHDCGKETSEQNY